MDVGGSSPGSFQERVPQVGEEEQGKGFDFLYFFWFLFF